MGAGLKSDRQCQQLFRFSCPHRLTNDDVTKSDAILIVERDKPDSHGARKVMISYDKISAVKITSVLELAQFQVMGFQAPM